MTFGCVRHRPASRSAITITISMSDMVSGVGCNMHLRPSHTLSQLIETTTTSTLIPNLIDSFETAVFQCETRLVSDSVGEACLGPCWCSFETAVFQCETQLVSDSVGEACLGPCWCSLSRSVWTISWSWTVLMEDMASV